MHTWEMQKLEPEKKKTGAPKHANPGHRKIEKLEPEKIHTSGAEKCRNRSPKNKKKAEPERIHTLGTEKCRNQSPKKRKTGARKDANPGHQKVEKPEPEK